MTKIKEKYKQCVDYYIQFGSQEQAALSAGYRATYAQKRAYEIFERPEVKEYLDAQLAKMASKRISDATEVMEYLTSVLRGESQAEIIVVEGNGEGCSSARHITKAPDEKERLKAAELIGKRYGLFTDRVEMSGSLETEKSKLDDVLHQMRGEISE